jgi:hypothetical protein
VRQHQRGRAARELRRLTQQLALVALDATEHALDGGAECPADRADRDRPQDGADRVQDDEARRPDAARSDGDGRDRAQTVEEAESEEKQRSVTRQQRVDVAETGGPARPLLDGATSPAAAEPEEHLVAGERAEERRDHHTDERQLPTVRSEPAEDEHRLALDEHAEEDRWVAPPRDSSPSRSPRTRRWRSAAARSRSGRAPTRASRRLR